MKLRKCIIEELTEDFKSFMVRDLFDDSQKEVFLSGNQRMFYTEFNIDDLIYAAKTSENKWGLVTETDFKKSGFLTDQRLIVDRYFSSLKD